jgi:hypothetical protein
MNLFDILKDLIKEKSGTLCYEEGFDKAWNSYMVIRYLSMDKRFIRYANIANKIQMDLDSIQMYKFLIKIIPQNNNTWIKYISKKKK